MYPPGPPPNREPTYTTLLDFQDPAISRCFYRQTIKPGFLFQPACSHLCTRTMVSIVLGRLSNVINVNVLEEKSLWIQLRLSKANLESMLFFKCIRWRKNALLQEPNFW